MQLYVFSWWGAVFHSDVYDDDGGELSSAALAWLAKPQAEERRECQAGRAVCPNLWPLLEAAAAG